MTAEAQHFGGWGSPWTGQLVGYSQLGWFEMVAMLPDYT